MAANAAGSQSSTSLPSASNDYDDLDESSSVGDFCLCFPAHCFGLRRRGSYLLQINHDEDQETHHGGGGGGRRWVVEKLKKAREISEVVAGPKWKNFIRRFSGSVRVAVGSIASKGNGNGKVMKRSSKMQFQYDAQSYALNFDDGVDTADDCGYPGFSVRYAAPPPPPPAVVGSSSVTNT